MSPSPLRIRRGPSFPNENYKVPWVGSLPDHICPGGSRNYRSHFHALGYVSWIIDLRNLAGCKAYLVAVGTVSGRRLGSYLPLRQFTRKRFRKRSPRVSAASYPHGLVYVASTREGIPYCSAQTCCCSSERLDFGRMVVGLVLEHNEPFLRFSIHFYLCFY